MKIVWNNPRPNRTLDRPLVWEVSRRNGTSRTMPAHQIQPAAGQRLDHRVKEDFDDLETLFSSGFCF
jgi:hypothetical protein